MVKSRTTVVDGDVVIVFVFFEWKWMRMAQEDGYHSILIHVWCSVCLLLGGLKSLCLIYEMLRSVRAPQIKKQKNQKVHIVDVVVNIMYEKEPTMLMHVVLQLYNYEYNRTAAMDMRTREQTYFFFLFCGRRCVAIVFCRLLSNSAQTEPNVFIIIIAVAFLRFILQHHERIKRIEPSRIWRSENVIQNASLLPQPHETEL